MAVHKLEYTRTDDEAAKPVTSEVTVVTHNMQAPDVWHSILSVWATQDESGRREIIRRLDAIHAAITNRINQQNAHLGPIAYQSCIQQHGEGSPLCPK